jgi:hypothetical protein
VTLSLPSLLLLLPMMLDLPSAFAADVGHNVEYNIRDLGTRSVTLFPAQAQVKRDIKDVPLKVSRAHMANLSAYSHHASLVSTKYPSLV